LPWPATALVKVEFVVANSCAFRPSLIIGVQGFRGIFKKEEHSLRWLGDAFVSVSVNEFQENGKLYGWTEAIFHSLSAAVGSIVLLISVIVVAGKPLISAWRWMTDLSSAR
jgi:hypothetical protein